MNYYAKDNLSPRATTQEALKIKGHVLTSTLDVIYECFMQATDQENIPLNAFVWSEHEYLQADQVQQLLMNCIIYGGNAVYTLGYLSGARAARAKHKKKVK